MNTLRYLEKLIPRTRRAFAVGVTLALGLLALVILAGWFYVRTLVREQIARRDAGLLYGTTIIIQNKLLELEGGREEFLESDEQIGFEAAIVASELDDVIGIRFFNPEGQFIDAFPTDIQPQSLNLAALMAVRQFQPHSRFRPDTLMSDIFIVLPRFVSGNDPQVPTFEVTVPLHPSGNKEKLINVAQFIVAGVSIAKEYAQLDRHLGWLAGLCFVVAGFLLAAMLWPAFRHVERLNRLLTQRNERLLRANQELALAARASALGSVSAHLMHGLRNPLASLSQIMATRHSSGADLDEDDWQDALTAARRMQSLVEQTLEVLSDAKGEPAYEITLPELAEAVRKRVETLAQNGQVELSIQIQGTENVSSRTANLINLILVNLVENAIQATPRGKGVSLDIRLTPEGLQCRVQDEGTGFPEHLRNQLFLPCKSTRESGSGIGLAISKQLADHLGASLELIDAPEGKAGCTFALSVPNNALREGLE